MADDCASIEDRLCALEARLAAAQDHLDILNLIGSYGPVIDSGWADEAVRLYSGDGAFHPGQADGGFDRLDMERLHAFYAGEDMRRMIATGCAHFNAVPRIRVEGDTARATNFSIVLMASGDAWVVSRAAINDWHLAREAGTWRIRHRYNRPVDGSEHSHALMRTVGESPK